MGVSENSGTPKSSILIGFSIINHPFWGTPIFGSPPYTIPMDDMKVTAACNFHFCHSGGGTSLGRHVGACCALGRLPFLNPGSLNLGSNFHMPIPGNYTYNLGKLHKFNGEKLTDFPASYVSFTGLYEGIRMDYKLTGPVILLLQNSMIAPPNLSENLIYRGEV